MRVLLTLVLAAIGAGCSAGDADDPPRKALTSTTVSDGRAPLSPFVPPTPAGCGGAAAYDLCFAFDKATPLAVHVSLPRTTRAGTVAVVRFHQVGGVHNTLVANQVKFKVGERSELDLYFQVYPGAYRIVVGVDADDDGDPDGPDDAIGWSASTPDQAVVDEADAALVDVATAPVATRFTLALR